MELVDRYLKSVGSYLPKEQKDDILRELSENIRSEIEDQEKELGRTLTEAEQEALVKRHGNPLLVAGRYRQEQRSVAFGRAVDRPGAVSVLYQSALVQPRLGVAGHHHNIHGALRFRTTRDGWRPDWRDRPAGIDSGRHHHRDFRHRLYAFDQASRSLESTKARAIARLDGR